MPKTTRTTSKATATANQDPSNQKLSAVAIVPKTAIKTKPATAKTTVSQAPVIDLLAPAKETIEESSEVEDDWEEEATAPPEQSMPSDLDSAQEGAPSKFTISHWEGDCTGAEGVVAKQFSRDSFTEQCRKVEALFKHKNEDNVSIMLDPTIWTPFLVAVPGAFRKVRVNYAVAIQRTTEAPADKEENNEKEEDSKFMWALQGEFALGLAYQKAMKIPGSAPLPGLSQVKYKKER